jgi:hypothetical protein
MLLKEKQKGAHILQQQNCWAKMKYRTARNYRVQMATLSVFLGLSGKK